MKGNSRMSYSLNVAPDTKQFCCLSVMSIRESELLIGESNKLLKTLNNVLIYLYFNYFLLIFLKLYISLVPIYEKITVKSLSREALLEVF
jgi:hypothetical protein